MANILGQLEQAQLQNKETDPSNTPDGLVWLNVTSGRFKAFLESAVRILVTENQTQTLTNKTIDDDNNVIQNLALGAIKTILGDANKFLVRDGTGQVISNLTVPTGSVVGTGQTNTFTVEQIFQHLITGAIQADTSTGATQTLPAPVKLAMRSSGALTSVAGIPSTSGPSLLLWLNATGSDVDILNDSGSATAANRILTGTGVQLKVKANANIWLFYDTSSSRWKVVGGSGGSTSETFGTVGSPRSVVAATGITSGASHMSTSATSQDIFVVGSVANQICDISANPQIQAHTVVGAEMNLLGTSDTEGVMFESGNGLVLNGPCVLYAGGMLSIKWDGSAWREKSRNGV